MNDNIPPPETPRSDAQPSQGIPWGQLTVATFGIWLCFHSIDMILKLFHMSEGDGFLTIGAVFFLAGMVSGITAIWQSRFGKHKGRPLPRRPWLRTANISIWTTYVMSILLTILIPAFHAGAEAARKSRQKNSADASGDPTVRPVISSDGRYLVEVPTNWHDFSSAIPASGWQIAQTDPTGQVCVVIEINSREDLTVRSLPEYADLCLAQFSKEFETLEIQEKTVSSTAARSMHQVLASTSKDGIRFTMLFQFLETPQSFVQLRGWGIPSAFRQHEPLLRSVLASFRETGVTPASPPR